MRVIIAGSRTIEHVSIVMRAVAESHWTTQITEVVSGTADGVDKAGEQYAEILGIPVKRFPPNYKVYNRRNAHRQRNLQMAVYADALIAVWDGKSPGTRHMIETANRMGIKVFVYRTDLEHHAH